MSPIVYVPHDCKPPRQGESVAPRRVGGWYPEGTIWKCVYCGSMWMLGYSPRKSMWCDETYSYYYSYYEIEWHRAKD